MAFVLALFLKQVPLRDTARAGAQDLGEGFAMPDAQDSDGELERAIARVVMREGATAGPGVLAASETGLAPATAWCLAQVRIRERYAGPVDVAAIARAYRIPPSVLRPAFDAAIASGFLRDDGEHLSLTPRGEADYARLAEAWKRWLETKLPEQDGHRPGRRTAGRGTGQARRPARRPPVRRPRPQPAAALAGG